MDRAVEDRRVVEYLVNSSRAQGQGLRSDSGSVSLCDPGHFFTLSDTFFCFGLHTVTLRLLLALHSELSLWAGSGAHMGCQGLSPESAVYKANALSWSAITSAPVILSLLPK